MIMMEGDGRTIVATAVVQSTASGAPLSIDTVLSFNGVANVNTAFTATTCKTKAVPLLVSTSLYFFQSFENENRYLSGRCKPNI